MKFYALPKVDGGVAIMQCHDGVDPIKEIARWPESQRSIVTGEAHEIDPASIPSDRADRKAWKYGDGKIQTDAAMKAEIEARPKTLTLEERVAALEARR